MLTDHNPTPEVPENTSRLVIDFNRDTGKVETYFSTSMEAKDFIYALEMSKAGLLKSLLG